MWCVCACVKKAQICLKLSGCRGVWLPVCLQRRAGWLDLAGCFGLGGVSVPLVMMGGGWMCPCVCVWV